jgi:hypothetical protein
MNDTLTSEERAPKPIGYEAQWTLQTVWIWWRQLIIPAPVENQTSVIQLLQ